MMNFDLLSDASEVHPARQPCLFKFHAGGCRREPPSQTNSPFPSRGRRDLPIQTASIYLLSDVGESLQTTQLDLFHLYLSDTASIDLPTDAGEVLPARQPYFFKSPRSARLTRP